MLDLVVALAIGAFSKVAFTDPGRAQAAKRLEFANEHEKWKENLAQHDYFRIIKRSVETVTELNHSPTALIYSAILDNKYNCKHVGIDPIPTYRSDRMLQQLGMTEEEFYVWIVNLWVNDGNIKHIYRKQGDSMAYEAISYYKTIAGRRMWGGSIYIPLANTPHWECNDGIDIDRSRSFHQRGYELELQDKFIELDPDEILRKYPKDLMDIVTGDEEWRKYEDKCGFLLNAPPRPKVAPHYDWEDEDEWKDEG